MRDIAGLLIVVYERFCFLVVNLDSVCRGLFVVILSLDELSSADISDAFLLWRDVHNVE